MKRVRSFRAGVFNAESEILAQQERIRSRIQKLVDISTDGCWLWLARKSSEGYGRLTISKDGTAKTAQAHRASYIAFVGPIPAGLQLDHLCRVPSCVNPTHLEPVTQAENVRRSRAGELNRLRILARSTCKAGHEWSESNTRIRSTNGVRVCRACTREWSRRRYAEKRVAS